MKRIELEALDIGTLRSMAEEAGIGSRKKAQIIAALANDYREGEAIAISTNGTEPQPTPPPQDDSEAIRWPEVPYPAANVNGSYVEPPWLDELIAAAQIGHVELMGPAGSGKTLAVHHLAAAVGHKLAVVTADGGLRKRDLVGQRELVGGRTVLMAAEFAAAARNGDWALIDEANMAEPDALAFLNGMTDRPGVGGSTCQVAGQTVKVHPEFRVFLTRNPGYVGTRAMNEALRDRFWSIEVPPLSGEALAEMFRAHGMREAYNAQSVHLIDILFTAWEDNRISYQISPRRALQAADMAKLIIGEADATDKFFREWLERAIMTKIDAKHDREAVQRVIEAAWKVYEIGQSR